MSLREDVLERIACPKCHGTLRKLPASFGCATCKLEYAVVDGVPNFLVDQASPWNPGEKTGSGESA